MNVQKTDKFVALILEFLKRPGLALINRVEDFDHIITGYLICENDAQSDNSELIDGFKKYVLESFEIDKDTAWARIIRFYSGDDKHSIELFGTLFREYIEMVKRG